MSTSPDPRAPASASRVRLRRGNASAKFGEWRARPWFFPVLLAFTAGLIAALLSHYAFNLWVHTLDDDLYYVNGRSFWHDLPGGILRYNDRGTQRIAPWLLGGSLELFGVTRGLKVVRAIELVAYASTVWPMWCWLRAFDVRRELAAAGAVLAVLTPWAVVTSVFMTEAITYPIATWALYMTWRTAAKPTLPRLIGASAVIFVALLARSVMMFLLPILIVTTVAVAVRFNIRGAWARRRAWGPRDYAPWLLMLVAVIIGVYYLEGNRAALAPITGTYSTSLPFQLSAFPGIVRKDLSSVISGIGILPGIVALAWLAKRAIRPVTPEAFSLVLLTLAVTALVSYSTYRAGPDERYIMYLAPPLIVAAVVALGRREVGPFSLMASAGVTIFLFSNVYWQEQATGYDYWVDASRSFHGKVLLVSLGSHVNDIVPFTIAPATTLAIGIVAVTALVAVAWQRWGSRFSVAVCGAAAVGLSAMQLLQVTYVDRKFVDGANFGPRELSARSWVDNAIGRDTYAGVFVTPTGPDVDNMFEIWREAAFFNVFHRTMFQMPGSGGLGPYIGDSAAIDIDPQSGRLTAPRPVPRLLVELLFTPKRTIYGRQIGAAGYLPLRLVRTFGTPRVRWLVTGSDESSYTMPDHPTRIRVYHKTGAGDCLRLVFSPPPDLMRARRVVVHSGRHAYSAIVRPRWDTELKGVRLTKGDSNAYGTVFVQARGTTPFFGQPRGVRLTAIERIACVS